MCRDHARTLALELRGDGQGLTVEACAYDDGAAVRLVVPGTGEAAILEETTAYGLPKRTGTVFAQRLLFTYEDQYLPVPRAELPQNRLAFPVLVKLDGGQWALYSEADVHGSFGGGHLPATPERSSRLALRRSPDQLFPIRTPYPVATPWRAEILLGDLNALAGFNLLENLNPPSIVADNSFIRPGLAAWSRMTENASTQDTRRIRQYVDYAAEMGWPCYLADGGWPGHVDIPPWCSTPRKRACASGYGSMGWTCGIRRRPRKRCASGPAGAWWGKDRLYRIGQHGADGTL